MFGAKKDKSFGIYFALSLMSLLLGSCSGSDLPCPLTYEYLAQPADTWIALTIENESCAAICDINISPHVCDDWGMDFLDIEHDFDVGSLPSGESMTVILPPGSMDILVEDCMDFYYIFEKIKLESDEVFTITSDGTSQSSECDNSLTVQNEADIPICFMWIAAPTSESFGGNWLGRSSIATGQSYTFPVPEGIYDLKAEGCDFERLRIELDVEINSHQTWVVE